MAEMKKGNKKEVISTRKSFSAVLGCRVLFLFAPLLDDKGGRQTSNAACASLSDQIPNCRAFRTD